MSPLASATSPARRVGPPFYSPKRAVADRSTPLALVAQTFWSFQVPAPQRMLLPQRMLVPQTILLPQMMLAPLVLLMPLVPQIMLSMTTLPPESRASGGLVA